ncbi:hypothetical protein V1478_012454, partial [Vespula squamosa]
MEIGKEKKSKDGEGNASFSKDRKDPVLCTREVAKAAATAYPWQETKDGEDDGSWVESEAERRMVAGVTRARNDFAKRTGERRSSSLLIESNASSMKTVFQANICLRIFSVILGSSEESKAAAGDPGKRGVKRPRSKASSPVRQGPQQCQRIEREEKRHEEGCTKARSNDVCLALEEGPSEGERSGFWHGDDGRGT